MCFRSRLEVCFLAAVAAAVLLPAGAWAQTVDIPYQGWLTQGDLPCSGT